MVGFRAGVTAFRQDYQASTPEGSEEWESWDGRRARYALYWGMFENNAYDAVRRWATKYKSDYGLYKYTRNIYNPAYRLAQFHRSHVWGGALHPDAAAEGALPIFTENEELRVAIATLWQASNWSTNKDTVPLWGATMGDAVLRVIDDAERGRVYLKLTHPGTLKDVTTDPFGNVKAYELQEERAHPERPKTTVVYTERASRDGDNVVYETFLDGKPYAWGAEAAWEEPYGFVPMVLLQHNNVGLPWGWAELHPCLSKAREVDDIASKTSDQIRKMVDAPWLLAGVNPPPSKPVTSGAAATTTDTQPGRQEIPMLYGAVGASATPLVAPLDLAAALKHIESISAEIEKEYPELRYDLGKARGEVSGRALRIARQDVETKMQERRGVYDNVLVRAQQMAVAIGGMRNYPGYEGFSLESYAAGELEHKIGERPVFSDDPLDRLEIEEALWRAASAAGDNGVSLKFFLKRQGWSDAEIDEVMQSDEYQARQAVRALGMVQPRRQPAAAGGTQTDPELQADGEDQP